MNKIATKGGGRSEGSVLALSQKLMKEKENLEKRAYSAESQKKKKNRSVTSEGSVFALSQTLMQRHATFAKRAYSAESPKKKKNTKGTSEGAGCTLYVKNHYNYSHVTHNSIKSTSLVNQHTPPLTRQ